jgi:hypothetical protein
MMEMCLLESTVCALLDCPNPIIIGGVVLELSFNEFLFITVCV